MLCGHDPRDIDDYPAEDIMRFHLLMPEEEEREILKRAVSIGKGLTGGK